MGFYRCEQLLLLFSSAWLQPCVMSCWPCELCTPTIRDLCFEGFDGWTSDPQTAWMNTVYGSTGIDGTDIIFPAGTIDPWHALGEFDEKDFFCMNYYCSMYGVLIIWICYVGVTNTTVLPQQTEHPLYILGTAHCADLYAPANSDPQSLVDARKVIASQVADWIR